MPTDPKLGKDDQAAAMTILVYLQDLFTTSGKDHFSRDEVLLILDVVGNDPELFAPGFMDTFKEELEQPE